MFGYIYKTINLINGKIYIGQHIAKEFEAEKYLGSGILLHKAVKKYGKENFKVILLESCDSKEQLDDRERYWILTLNSQEQSIGYNLTSGGEGNNGGMFKGHKHSTKSLNKISKAMHEYNQKYRAGKKMTDICPNFVNGMKGKEAKNKDCIKIYNLELDIIKYIKKDDSIDNYPGFIIGGRKRSDNKPYDLSYTKDPEYLAQLKERFKNTHFIHNDELKLCKRVKENEIDNYLKNGWELGRVIYSKINTGE